MKIVNHYRVAPPVYLTSDIKATSIIDPDGGGRMSAHEIWMPADTEYPPHQHPSPHILIVLEGGGWVWCGQTDRRSLLDAGDVFSVLENVPHQVGADYRGTVLLAVSVDSLPLTDPARMEILS